MTKSYDSQWENALTVVQEVQPPFIPENAHAMTVTITYRPAARAPRRTAILVVRRSATCSKARCCSSWKVNRRAHLRVPGQ